MRRRTSLAAENGVSSSPFWLLLIAVTLGVLCRVFEFTAKFLHLFQGGDENGGGGHAYRWAARLRLAMDKVITVSKVRLKTQKRF
jgi:hypothetical protein